MWGDVEVISDNLGLSTLVNQYRETEKRFWDIIWSQIWDSFPEGFDKSLLKLDDVIANIMINADEWDGWTHLARIKDADYDGAIVDLYDEIKWLHGLELDEFYIEIQWYNFKNDRNDFHQEETYNHQINFRVKRKTKVIDWEVIWEDAWVKWDTARLIWA